MSAMNDSHILIIEDTLSAATAYKSYIAPLNIPVLIAANAETAYEMIQDYKILCIIIDLNLPDADGMQLLIDLKSRPASPPMLVVSVDAAISTAIKAVRCGAYDYLVKPFSAKRLLDTVKSALTNSLSAPKRQDVHCMTTKSDANGFASFIGISPQMQAVYRTIQAAAPTSANVLITGESGSGKELAAEALHKFSRRADKPFVALNCAAIPRDLIESVIFGHIKGSFTGAVSDQEGAAGRADGGTLFLDELGEMDILLQTKLLRFIQTGSYQRLGEGKMRQANIRFIAATNRDPNAAILSGHLREDLYYRLNVISISLPSLHTRGADVMLIANSFLREFAAEDGREFIDFSPEVAQWMSQQSWPGNVRQLRNFVRSIVILNNGTTVTQGMVPQMIGQAPQLATASDVWISDAQITLPKAPHPLPIAMPTAPINIDLLMVMEKRYIENAIQLCSGNLQLAARKLGISPSTIYRKKEAW